MAKQNFENSMLFCTLAQRCREIPRDSSTLFKQACIVLPYPNLYLFYSRQPMTSIILDVCLSHIKFRPALTWVFIAFLKLRESYLGCQSLLSGAPVTTPRTSDNHFPKARGAWKVNLKCQVATINEQFCNLHTFWRDKPSEDRKNLLWIRFQPWPRMQGAVPLVDPNQSHRSRPAKIIEAPDHLQTTQRICPAYDSSPEPGSEGAAQRDPDQSHRSRPATMLLSIDIDWPNWHSDELPVGSLTC